MAGRYWPSILEWCISLAAVTAVVIQWRVWCQGVVGSWGWGSGGCSVVGGVRGVGGVERGVKTHRVVGVAGQGAQGVVMGVGQGVADREGQQAGAG